ncbi:tyrosine-type recombinase/integrase [Mycolicibacterium llatzerense]|uniref:Integrase n=1 Tax=Mycolicibacterium llatzerense TaxID=280871 RepID=A0A0D1LHD6_9MYCO|nr:site-specific integrase [Mycolicibacterium llatzerense]KIU17872.1 hypothetical protein TL10_06320 [Mycolicibacterium llatzerense]
MASVSVRERPRADGSFSYVVQWRDTDGRQRTLTFSRSPVGAENKAEADALAAAMKARGIDEALKLYGIELEPVTRTERKPLTVAQWVRTYIDSLTGLEQGVMDNYESYLAGDIEARPIGAVPVAKLAEEHIRAWVATLQTEGSAKKGSRPNGIKTITNKHGFMSGALAAAVDKGHATKNPFAGRTLPKANVDHDHDMRMLTRPEYDQLLAATAESWQPMLAFMVSSGMRWGEIAALQPKHVDLRTNTVMVRQAWKRSKEGYRLGMPKTKRSRRTINVPADVLAELDLSGEWVFTNQTDGGPCRYPAFRNHVWNPAVARSALNPAPTPHDMRHTYASWQLANGVPITTVSRQLGHESIQTTVNLYGDVDRAAFEAAANVMAAILKSTKPA